MFAIGFYVKRCARMLYVIPRSLLALTATLIVEAWHEKTVVSLVALTVDEENAMRIAREKLARYLGVARITPEEYLMLMGAVVPYYIGQSVEPLSKTEASRLLMGRRRAKGLR